MVHYIYSILFLCTFLADRITKQLALIYAQQEYVVTRYLSFELLFNRGVSWSMFHSDSSLIFGCVTLVVTAIACTLTYYAYERYRAGNTIVGELLILAGAYSNILDRSLYRGVIDFIQLGYNSWTFPVFNIADVAIIIGVIFMLWIHTRDI